MRSLAIFIFAIRVIAQQGPPPQGHNVLDDVIMSATSEDGLTWKTDERILADRASVPDVVARKDGPLWCCFCDFTQFHGGGQERIGLIRWKDGFKMYLKAQAAPRAR